MKKQNKIYFGILCSLVGFILSIFAIDLLSKPDNVAISFDPIDSLSGFFFTFVFMMGTIGWLIGSLVLIIYLSAFYFLGTWIYNVIYKQK